MFRFTSAIAMVIALLWLTVSTPFVYHAQKSAAAITATTTDEEAAANLLSNTTEEKSETSVNTLSEYLHDHSFLHELYSVNLEPAGLLSVDTYIAFNPEAVSPPPERLS